MCLPQSPAGKVKKVCLVLDIYGVWHTAEAQEMFILLPFSISHSSKYPQNPKSFSQLLPE